MSLTVVTGGTLSGTSNATAKTLQVGADRSSYILSTHSAKEPRLIVFSRKLPGGGAGSVLMVGVKIVFGDLNADDTPRSGNVIVEATVRIPQDQPASLAQEAVTKMVEILRDSNIMTDALDDGLIPMS